MYVLFFLTIILLARSEFERLVKMCPSLILENYNKQIRKNVFYSLRYKHTFTRIVYQFPYNIISLLFMDGNHYKAYNLTHTEQKIFKIFELNIFEIVFYIKLY